MKSIERIVGVAKLSISVNAITAVGKIVVSIFTGSLFLLLNAFYSVGIGMAKGLSVNPRIVKSKSCGEPGNEFSYDAYYIVGIIILLASLCYMLYSITFFFGKNNTKYPIIAGISIATFTFSELALSIRGIIVARKNKNIQAEAIKLINLASSLISLVLTQTAIMSFSYTGEMSALYFYNGISGIVFGFLASLIGIYMIIYTHIAEKAKKTHKK